MEQQKETLGKRIAMLRKEKGLTQEQLAEKVGVSSGTAALRESLVELGSGLDALKSGILKLEEALGLSSDAAVLSAMQALRTTVDSLEKRVADSRWPLPKYRDMLFLY